jgi:hypothetical protein
MQNLIKENALLQRQIEAQKVHNARLEAVLEYIKKNKSISYRLLASAKP